MTDLSILMPAFNECRTVAEAVDQVLGVKYPVEEVELLVVDDGSSDGTGAVLDEIGNHRAVKVFHHERNQGKGAAVRTGPSTRAAPMRPSWMPILSTSRGISQSFSNRF